MKYSLGLDIGTSSVGWALIDEDNHRIADIGVRIFERPENPKDGKSLALPRREARSARRRISRRRSRLNQLKRFFIREKLLTREQISQILTADNSTKYNEFDPYEIRSRALDEKVTNEELFRALYHIAKRRGYKSNRRSDTTKKEEDGKVLSAISENSKLFDKNNGKYRTIGEAIFKDERFTERKRNGNKSYINSFQRADFEYEFRKILQKQGFSEDKIEAIFNGEKRDFYGDEVDATGVFAQRPFTNQYLINRMRGKDSLDNKQNRAPKATASFEIFRAAQELRNLTLINEENSKDQRILTKEEIAEVINNCITNSKVSYQNIRKFAKIDDKFKFNYIRGKKTDFEISLGVDGKPNKKEEKRVKELEAKYIKKNNISKNRFLREIDEKNTLYEHKFLNAINAVLEGDDKNIISRIKDISQYKSEIFRENLIKLDKIGESLTVWNTDEKIHESLSGVLSEETIGNILNKGMKFTGFADLGCESLQKITPFILDGETYSNAVKAAGYSFQGQKNPQKYLPKLTKRQEQEITNPVVKRAIRQTIEVVNAIVKKHGSPYYLKIETARDLAKNRADRNKMDNKQKDNFKRNEEIKSTIQAMGISNPRGQDILKYKLWQIQHEKSLYSDTQIDQERLFEDGYVEIDHIIPFSRCGNDSLDNKALVLSSENQDKSNKTLFEWKGKTSEWPQLKARIESLNISKKKRDNLLVENLEDSNAKSSWNERALNDTRFISSFLCKYFENNLDFSELTEEDNKRAKLNKSGEIRRVLMPTGQITSYLRKRWGLSKSRDENNLHHAQDAAVVAAISQKMIAAASMYDKYNSLKYVGDIHEKIREIRNIIKNGENNITNKETGEIFSAEDYLKYLEDIEQDRKGKLVFPQPYKGFRDEVQGRLMDILNEENGSEHFKEWALNFYGHAEDSLDFVKKIHPIFVSRFRKKKVSGPSNEETLRSPVIWEKIDGVMEKTNNKDSDNPWRLCRKSVDNISLTDLDNSPVRQTDPQVYNTLKKYISTRDVSLKGKLDGEEFKENTPWKLNAKGEKISEIKNIKVWYNKKAKSGFYINNNQAFVNNGNGGMIRVDLYKWCGEGEPMQKIRYKVMPVYVRERDRVLKPSKFFKSKDNIEDVNYQFEMQIWKNDYIEIIYDSGENAQGYYNSFDINGDRFTLTEHKSPRYGRKWSKDKKGYEKFRKIPGKALVIRKTGINVLGDNFPTSFHDKFS